MKKLRLWNKLAQSKPHSPVCVHIHQILTPAKFGFEQFKCTDTVAVEINGERERMPQFRCKTACILCLLAQYESMDQEIKKKATEMLLCGATLMAEPCPYCSGVRVIKDGNALCIECGSAPGAENDKKAIQVQSTNRQDVIDILESKILKLAKDLDIEDDLSKQLDILKSIQAVSKTIRSISSGPD